jgi:hypothetical protein
MSRDAAPILNTSAMPGIMRNPRRVCHENEGHLLLSDEIDLCSYLGLPERRIPVRMRLPDDKTGYCSSLAALFAMEDPRPGGAPIDPRSGGIVGWRAFAEALGGVSQRTARRVLAGPYGKSVQRVAGVPGTVSNTATAIKGLHEAAVAEERRMAGRKGGRPRACPVSAGSGRLEGAMVDATGGWRARMPRKRRRA